MTAGDFYRIEFRIQNSVQKYYLIREIFSDAKKFSASRLITSGTPPTRTEINRCASLYGFELELKCIAKAAKYRAEEYKYDQYDDADAVVELERFRLLLARRMQLSPEEYVSAYIASIPEVTFDADEIARMFSAGTIPRGKTLSEVNLVQNLFNAFYQRDGKPVSVSRLYKQHAVLSANLGGKPLSPDLRPALEKRIAEFSRKIKSGFYPFEQCVLLYQDLSELLPEETVFLTEVYASLLAGFGYILFPADAPTFEEAVSFVRFANPGLEREVRRLNEEKFRVKAGGKQKQLELF